LLPWQINKICHTMRKSYEFSWPHYRLLITIVNHLLRHPSRRRLVSFNSYHHLTAVFPRSEPIIACRQEMAAGVWRFKIARHASRISHTHTLQVCSSAQHASPSWWTDGNITTCTIIRLWVFLILTINVNIFIIAFLSTIE
jgi:hypothetical protein